jgi:ribulose 1,5-bisphosphate synthetase/thiazole synthase
LTDWEDGHGGFVAPAVPAEKLEKVAVVGSGPAGMTCARDLALKGYQVTVFEKLPVAGGMLRVSIPAYRLPKDVVQQEVEEKFRATNDELHVASFEAQFAAGIIQPTMTLIGNLNFVAIAVIGGLRVASGAMSIGDIQAFIQYSRQFTMR